MYQYILSISHVFFSRLWEAGFWKTKVAWNTDYIFRFGQAGNTRIIPNDSSKVGELSASHVPPWRWNICTWARQSQRQQPWRESWRVWPTFSKALKIWMVGMMGKRKTNTIYIYIYEVFEPWTKCSMQIFLGFCMPYHHTIDFFSILNLSWTNVTWHVCRFQARKKTILSKDSRRCQGFWAWNPWMPRALGL